MKRLDLSLLTASLMGGCILLGGCTTSYTWDAHQGPGRAITYTRHDHTTVDPDKVAAVAGAVLDTTLQVAGTASAGYAEGVAEYQYTHPTVYIQPSFIQPQPIYTQQTFHVTPFGGGYRVW